MNSPGRQSGGDEKKTDLHHDETPGVPNHDRTERGPDAAFARSRSARRGPCFRRLLWSAALLFLVLFVGCFLCIWAVNRLTTSETDDAFVESHIVNVAPQVVTGHIVRFLVEEDQKVKQGDVLAEIDPTHYQDQVDIAQSQLDAAQAQLDRLREEVPIQVAIAQRMLASAQAEHAKVEEVLRLTRDEVDRTIDEANAALAAAKADQTLAQVEYDRYTKLLRDDAATKQKAQQAQRARDAADAQVSLAKAKLALAQAERRKNDVAARDVEAALTVTQKAAKNVDLAQTGNAQIHEAELQTVVKKAAVEDAKDQLRYTKIRAPFPGVVVKRYRHLGDFASPGVAVLSMYNPDLLYVTANLEEDRLPGVAPGNPVRIDVDAVTGPFQGRVVWISKSTGAEFALMPRNVVSGEFTRVVQRVPVRSLDREGRPLAATAGRPVRAREHRSRQGGRRLGRQGRAGKWPTRRPATTRCSPRPPRPNQVSRNEYNPRRIRRRSGRAGAAGASPLAGGPGDALRPFGALPDPHSDGAYRRRRAEGP